MGVETLLIAAGGAMAAGQIMEGIQGYQEGQAAAGVTRAQIGATKVQRARDQADLRREQSSNLARMRAIFSAQGGAGSGVQESLILRDQRYLDAVSSTRLLQDYDYRLNTLRATASNQKRSAMQSLVGGIAKGGISAAGTAIGVQNYRASLLNSSAPAATGSAV